MFARVFEQSPDKAWGYENNGASESYKILTVTGHTLPVTVGKEKRRIILVLLFFTTHRFSMG